MGVLDKDYLHLHYVNFDENGAMANIIAERKNAIKERMKSKLKDVAMTSAAVEEEYERLYNIKEEDFNTQIDIPTDVSNLMSDFDYAVRTLKILLDQHKGLVHQRNAFNRAMSDIDAILALGANTGFVTESAINEIKNAKNTIALAKDYFSTWAKHDSAEGKEAITAAVKTLEAGAAGYIFEFAHAYGKAIAKKKADSTIHELFINIGGSATLSDTLRREGKESPEFQKALNELANAIDSNNGQQPKGDQILMYHEVDGQGQVIGETKFVVFQNKNFKEIDRIHVYNTTFGQLGIEQEFGTNDIVNIAGGLGSNAQWIAKTIHNSSSGPTQGEIDAIWRDIRSSMRLLAIADAIAGDINDNITMRPNYYVIRQKGGGEVRVIGTSRILNKIRTDLNNAAVGASMGIGWNLVGESWKSSTRERYWKFNIGNFVTSKRGEEAGIERSRLAYPWILQTINAQKISIALNFSEYFSK